MPNRRTIGGETYRYAFQGQEKDSETGKEAFELRLWDGRIGRWLTTDPYGQFHSPYLGMGNNPINFIDPDGGSCVDAQGNSIPCPDGYGHFSGPTVETGLFWDGEYAGLASSLVELTFSSGPSFLGAGSVNSNISNIQGNNINGYLGLTLAGIENFGGTVNLPKVNNLGLRYRDFSSGLNFVKGAKIGSNLLNAAQLSGDAYKVLTTKGQEQEFAKQGLAINTGIVGVSYVAPAVGVIITAGQIMVTTDEYKQGLHNAKQRQIRKRLEAGEFGVVKIPTNLEFRKSSGYRECPTCPLKF